jgi:hypothetical protein
MGNSNNKFSIEQISKNIMDYSCDKKVLIGYPMNYRKRNSFRCIHGLLSPKNVKDLTCLIDNFELNNPPGFLEILLRSVDLMYKDNELTEARIFSMLYIMSKLNHTPLTDIQTPFAECTATLILYYKINNAKKELCSMYTKENIEYFKVLNIGYKDLKPFINEKLGYSFYDTKEHGIVHINGYIFYNLVGLVPKHFFVNYEGQLLRIGYEIKNEENDNKNENDNQPGTDNVLSESSTHPSAPPLASPIEQVEGFQSIDFAVKKV